MGMYAAMSDDQMNMLVFYRTDKQPITRAQYDAVVDVAKEMDIVLGWQISSPFEAGVSGFLAYGLAGAAGGATQPNFYAGAAGGAATGYTAAVYGFGGVVSGITTYSYARVYAIGSMVEITLRDREKAGEAAYRNLHVVGSFVRVRNSKTEPAPGLAKQMPDWKGPQVGTPVR